MRRARTDLLIFCFAVTMLSATAIAQSLPFERTEEREHCDNHDALRRPLFGDLHVHTSYSFDSYISSQRNDPDAAYRYAKGEAIELPDEDGNPTIVARIQRPLDFTSVTDHSEYLGQINVCTTDASRLGYWWPHCVMTRSSNLWAQLLAASWWISLSVVAEDEGSRSFACTLSDCDGAGADTWRQIQQAADAHYDRSSRCSFTTFVGYEYTDAPNHFNMHRNVIFRNESVTAMPISTYETGSYNFPKLWKLLRQECIEAGTGCDVLAIPHNPNLAGGLMFRDPETPDEATDRLFFEPVPIDRFARRNMMRNVLKDGLALGQESGTNPFAVGFIGSTDTHSATPGGAEEDNYVGHLGRRDSGYRNVQDHFFSNPGGHAVVWAEENSRDSIFAGLRRDGSTPPAAPTSGSTT